MEAGTWGGIGSARQGVHRVDRDVAGASRNENGADAKSKPRGEMTENQHDIHHCDGLRTLRRWGSFPQFTGLQTASAALTCVWIVSPLRSRVMTTLWLDFAGIGYSANESLSFGRNAELALDEDNRFMHRITGEFRWNGLVWWLHNVGTSTRLLVFGTNGARIDLPPGTECALPMPAGSVSFLAGPTPYQLLYRADEPVVSTRAPDAPGDATVEFGTALTDRETIYLTSFALTPAQRIFDCVIELCRGCRALGCVREDRRQHVAAGARPDERGGRPQHRNARGSRQPSSGARTHWPLDTCRNRRGSPRSTVHLTSHNELRATLCRASWDRPPSGYLGQQRLLTPNQKSGRTRIFTCCSGSARSRNA